MRVPQVSRIGRLVAASCVTFAVAFAVAGLPMSIVRGVSGQASPPSFQPARQTASDSPDGSSSADDTARTPLRLHGLVEPVSSYAVTVPRLAAGQAGPPSQLVVVKLAPSGTLVRPGDVLVEFDRQGQLKQAHDREAEYRDFVAQIRKKRAEIRAARTARETALAEARHAVRIAELDLLGVDMLPAIQAEKNRQALEEATAHLAALEKTRALHERVEAADLRILEIQRDRALHAWHNARDNARRMLITSPIDGLVVLKSIWKSGTMAVVQEGEEVRPGIPILDVVDTSAMRVRAVVNQADVAALRVGQRAAVTLDSYPARSFEARLEHLSPVARASALNPRVRGFVALFSLEGRDPHLLPDLAAAIDVHPEPARAGGAGLP